MSLSPDAGNGLVLLVSLLCVCLVSEVLAHFWFALQVTAALQRLGLKKLVPQMALEAVRHECSWRCRGALAR